MNTMQAMASTAKYCATPKKCLVCKVFGVLTGHSDNDGADVKGQEPITPEPGC